MRDKKRFCIVSISLFFFLFSKASMPDSLCGKYLHEYHYTVCRKKQSKIPISGWDYMAQDIKEELTLRKNGTFEIKRISPQSCFEVLPITGQWHVGEDSALVLFTDKYPDGTHMGFFQKTFSIFNGRLVEKCAANTKKNPEIIAAWIKQH